MSPQVADFASAYQRLVPLSSTSWFKEMQRLRNHPHSYQALDAAQLVKHAFGLMKSGGEGATLVYLYWEPDDADKHELFRRHRDEIASFAKRIRSDRLGFVSMSYLELWEAWQSAEVPDIARHADRLRCRYGGRLGSYEGYS